MKKNKILKILLQTVGIISIFCIIPSCIISCSNSSESNNSNNNQQNNNSSTNFINTNVSSTDDNFTKTSCKQWLDNLNNNSLTSSQQNAVNVYNSMMNVYESSSNSANFTISLSNFSNSFNTTFAWYEMNDSEWANNLLQYSENSSNNASKYQIEQNIIDGFVNDGKFVSNNETYSFNGTIPAGGKFFVCQIKSGQNVLYSKICLIYYNVPATTSNSNSNNNNQQNLIYATCTSSNKNLKSANSFQNYLNYLLKQNYYI